jgi:tricorn protease
VPRRLTSGLGLHTHAALSPDDGHIAFVGREEGVPDVYVIPVAGGKPVRLTFQGAPERQCAVLGWSADGERVRFSSNVSSAFVKLHSIYEIPVVGGEPRRVEVGPARFLSEAPDGSGARVLARHQDDLAYWKRYRGGTAGVLWVDPDGQGAWRRLVDLKGNLARPLWVGDRIFFLSDHEGVGHLYSTTPTGEDLRCESSGADHLGHYVRHPATDGERIVYHAGAELWLLEPGSGEAPSRIEMDFASPRSQRARRFVDAESYLEEADLHPEGHSVALTVRGRPYTMGFWEGAALQRGRTRDARYRLASYLPDGKALVMVSDEGGEEALEIHPTEPGGDAEVHRLSGLDVGRPLDLAVCPVGRVVAFSNHRHEVVLVDLEERSARIVDRSPWHRMEGLAWSPDGRWIAYGCAETENTFSIKLAEVASGQVHRVTDPEFRDTHPSFDPEGRYLYFLSHRDFDPVYDEQHFDLGFPSAMRLCLLTLQADLPSPFVAVPKPLSEDPKDDSSEAKGSEEDEGNDEAEPIRIDLDGIAQRVLVFPVGAGTFGQVAGTSDRVLFSSFPIEGSLGESWSDAHEQPNGTLRAWDFERHEEVSVMSEVSAFLLAPDGKTLLVWAGSRLRVMAADSKEEKGDAPESEPGRKSGWLDLDRLSVEVHPGQEWRQMLRETWRLMRDHFWTEDMSGVDWEAVFERYAPLVDRVGSRAEFSDLVWEMQGELGTSHAYEIGGDYRRPPEHGPGFLGADFAFDAAVGGYRVGARLRGDTWDPEGSAPLSRPGVDLREGDVILAINGQRVSAERSVQSLLVNQADREVALTVAARPGEAAPRQVTVKTLRDEGPTRYRDWVDQNRRRVHEASEGRIGYLHIPDMGPWGYSEFHRGYLAEVARPALLVDVRFNRGGHVSPLLLEKLARRRLGYGTQRWGHAMPYPPDSVMGPMVALTNEYAGSDGDIFSHCFKLMELGPLVGMRTWGGVIGIWPRHRLVDGSVTTQPEFSFWFSDVGWGVENYGTDPDLVVDIAPQDYATGRDPQLERGLEVLEELLAQSTTALPDMSSRPRRQPPWQS